MWARGHLNWCDGPWQHFVFSDESRFVLYRQDGRVRVLRQAHEALLDECIQPRAQAGGGGVTIWGVCHSRGKYLIRNISLSVNTFETDNVLK